MTTSVFRYKVIEDQTIITIEIPEDALTNESRIGILDPDFAEYRANKAHIVKGSGKSNYRNPYYAKPLIYNEGEIVYPDRWDTDIQIVSTHGIHYFKTYDAAYAWAMSVPHDGIFQNYYSNGGLRVRRNYVGGKLVGPFEERYQTGGLKRTGQYVNNYLDGRINEYTQDGKLTIIVYKQGHRDEVATLIEQLHEHFDGVRFVIGNNNVARFEDMIIESNGSNMLITGLCKHTARFDESFDFMVCLLTAYLNNETKFTYKNMTFTCARRDGTSF